MFFQKEETNHVLGNHKGARDHCVNLLVNNEIMRNVTSSLLEFNAT